MHDTGFNVTQAHEDEQQVRPGWHIATRGPSKGKLVRDRKDERAPAEPVQGGSITREQAQRLADLIATKETRHVEWEAAQDWEQKRHDAFTVAAVELDEFIAALTAK